MVTGLSSFKKHFSAYAEQYTIIGGTACDLLMTENGIDFRATKDVDMVLIVEALTAEFGAAFWNYIKEAGYEHKNKSTGEPQFYRFCNPISHEYPAMIELFSRNVDAIPLPNDAILTPLPLDDELSSLSAILMDSEYYQFMQQGRVIIEGIPILDEYHIIPFKAKAFLDLSARKSAGESVDSKNIRKHKNDVFRLSLLFSDALHIELSTGISNDMKEFITQIENEDVDMKSLGIRNLKKEDILTRLRELYLI